MLEQEIDSQIVCRNTGLLQSYILNNKTDKTLDSFRINNYMDHITEAAINEETSTVFETSKADFACNLKQCEGLKFISTIKVNRIASINYKKVGDAIGVIFHVGNIFAHIFAIFFFGGFLGHIMLLNFDWYRDHVLEQIELDKKRYYENKK